jgi:hypothetical protein
MIHISILTFKKYITTIRKRFVEVFISMLRDYIKNKIFNELNYDIFRFEDFKVVEVNASESILQIENGEYYFKMKFELEMEYCEIRFSPGKVFKEEKWDIELPLFENVILNHLHDWLNGIKDDMLNPIEKRFIDDSIQKFREEIESKFEEIEDGFFTKDEGDILRERLEQIENIILERDSQEELQAEISKMKEEIQFLKATIDTLTKKKWLKNALIKMWSWGQKEENRKLIESGLEAVKTISQMDIPKL